MMYFWKYLNRAYGYFQYPFVFVNELIVRFLWDMYWYKHIVPKLHQRPYTPTSFRERIRHAWHVAQYGKE